VIRWLALALACTGCDALFGLDGVTVIDAAPPPVDASDCQTAAITDTFSRPGEQPCDLWGVALGDTSIANGELVAVPETDGAQSGCDARAAEPLVASGVFVEVPQIGTHPDEYTFLTVYTTPDTGPAWSITAGGGNISFGADGDTTMIPYDPTGARWWRIRPSAGVMVGELSPDGLTWTTLGVSSDAPPMTVSPKLGIGAGGGEPTTTEAHFAQLGVCP